jgi:hypothetical protein
VRCEQREPRRVGTYRATGIPAAVAVGGAAAEVAPFAAVRSCHGINNVRSLVSAWSKKGA